MAFFAWLEQTGLSTWLRESPSLWAFPFVLYLHTLGLAMSVGIGSAFAIWAAMFASRYPTAPMRQLFPLIWFGFAVNALSGVLLLLAYPAKALTNPVFYVKLAAVFIAVGLLQFLDRGLSSEIPPRQGRSVRRAAVLSLIFWAVATVTGRFLAYTHSVLMSSEMVY